MLVSRSRRCYQKIYIVFGRFLVANPQFNDKSRWLSLRDACQILDVSQNALRQWADGGHLRVYRTPGGHRRFLREDVDAFTGPSAAPAENTDRSDREEMEGSALRRIRRRLHGQSVASQAWHSSVDDESRFRMRLFGRRLLTLLGQDPSNRPRRNEAMTEAYLVGRQYGSEMAEKDVGLKDTVEAFIFFRTIVLDSAAIEAWSGMLEIADRVLVGLTESFEDRLAGAKHSDTGDSGKEPDSNLSAQPLSPAQERLLSAN